jgi:hypothetical protein
VQDKYPMLKKKLAQIGESRVKRASAPVACEAIQSKSPPQLSAASKEIGRDSQEVSVALPQAASLAPKPSGDCGWIDGSGGEAKGFAADFPPS